MGLGDVGDLTGGQDKPERVAKRIDRDMNFTAQAAARATDSLIESPPFAPAACWCALTMVESMMRYSKSGSSTKALKRLSQTPFLAHRRKRWNTLFQAPNSKGRSRHGDPVRAIQRTASMNKRLSLPLLPRSPLLPGMRSSIRSHCRSVSARRIKIASFVCDLESHSQLRGNPLNVNRA